MKFSIVAFTLLLALCVASGCSLPACAASPSDKHTNSIWFNESGLITGVGTSNIANDRHYAPILVIWHLSKDLGTYLPQLKGHRGKLSFICEPQLNPAFRPETDIEFGIGVGLKYTYPLINRLDAYLMGSVGPHYMSLQTDEQHSGFIFADSIGAGLNYRITSNTAVNIGYRYRHLSNAGLKSPNSGINTQFVTVGCAVYF